MQKPKSLTALMICYFLEVLKELGSANTWFLCFNRYKGFMEPHGYTESENSYPRACELVLHYTTQRRKVNFV